MLRDILRRTRTIACVGASLNPARPSHYVSEFLRAQGKRVIPVNPGHAGKALFGETIHASLSQIDTQIDMVDVFRRSDAVPALVDEALQSLPGLRTIWLQLGVRHDAAAETARAAGITVIQNRCPKIEYQRLFSTTA